MTTNFDELLADIHEGLKEELAILPTKQMSKPIMSPEVEAQVLDALAQYQNKDKWAQWGMHKLRKQGAAILLHGPTGTGKTTIAKWAAARIKKGFIEIDVAKIGGGNPGDSERGIRSIFEDARNRKNPTLFLDECDHLLGERTEISADGRTWQLGATETLMMEINMYEGMLICATNHGDMLDSALDSRFLAVVHVDNPTFDMRLALWKQKLGLVNLPWKPSEGELRKIANFPLTGRTIENVIVNAAGHCIRKGIRPNGIVFTKFANAETSKSVKK